MKTKFMRLIALIMLFINVCAYSQGINNNWLFGDYHWFQHAGNNFVTGSALNGLEASATVSDCEGNLLFYTNGNTVWNRNHQVMPNGNGTLIGGSLNEVGSSTQVVIIPQPGSSNIYYIITPRQAEDEENNSTYTFSIVDLNLDSGLGDVTPVINQPLLDQTGSANLAQNQTSQEAVTVCLRADGSAYLVLIPFDDNLYTYEINNSGLVNLPVVSPLLSNFHMEYVGTIKVSPDGSRLAVCDLVNGVAVYNFDSLNGVITSHINNINPFVPANTNLSYTLEFSPNSNLLYFIDYTWSSGSYTARLHAWDFILSAERIIPNPFPSALSNGIQINDENEVFVTSRNRLLRIDNPDDYTNASLVSVASYITTQPDFFCTLPQRIPSELNCCLPILTTNNQITTTVERERSEWIRTTDVINNATTNRVVYHAGNFVELRPGFETRNSSKVAAYIEGCTNDYVYKNVNSNGSAYTQTQSVKSLTISPNPSNSFIDLNIKNDTFNKIVIVTIDGRMVLDKTVETTNSYNLDISRYASGVYIVNVISGTGKQYSQKLIKN